MADKILFLDVILKERIWGGNYLKKIYNQEYLQANIGEAWLVSGHKEGQSTILNGTYKGQKLNDVYLNHRDLFGNSNQDRFPLLIKYIDAMEDLSIQVHPDDVLALKTRQDFGKTECWYILDAKKDSYIVDGHTAKDLNDFKDMFTKGLYDKLFTKRKIKPKDFIFIPAGLVHAIGAGIKILEVQQSSDVIYRLYDYNRVDVNGNKRTLHIDDALECIAFDKKQEKNTNRLVVCDKFSVDEFSIFKELEFLNFDYSIIYVIDGNGQIDLGDTTQKITKNDIFILTSKANNYKITGKLNILHIKEGNVSIDKILKAENNKC